MDEEELEVEIDFGIVSGDHVVVETEGNLLAGVFMCLTGAGWHLNVTHEIETIQDGADPELVELIRSEVAELPPFELIEAALEQKVKKPWTFSEERLRTVVLRALVELIEPKPRQALVAKSHPIRRIIPEHQVVSVDHFDDWKLNNTLKNLEFEPELEDDEEDEEDEQRAG